MPGLAALWWGGESPRATLLPPRRLRAALHLVRRHQKHRCARLEPRSAFSRMRLTAARARPTYFLPDAASLSQHAWACAHAEFASFPGRLRALPAIGATASESDDVIAATVLLRRRYFAFCVFVHVIAPWRAPLPCERALWHERRSHADLAVAKPRRPSWSGGICSARESARESRAAQTAELVAGSGMGWRGMLWVCGGRRSADGRQSDTQCWCVSTR